MSDLDRAKAKFRDFVRESGRQAQTPVDVAAGENDSDLDDHLWMRVSGLAGSYSADEVLRLPVDSRAYLLTRLFEWSTGQDGSTAFVDFYPHLMDYVGDAYRHLGLMDAASAFEAFRTARPVRRLLDDPDAMPTQADLEILADLTDAIGWHDEERLAFARAHPESFSI